jgi:hypothetical protein
MHHAPKHAVNPFVIYPLLDPFLKMYTGFVFLGNLTLSFISPMGEIKYNLRKIY